MYLLMAGLIPAIVILYSSLAMVTPNHATVQGVPPFKYLPDAAGATGNPHTCQQPTGDPHLDPDNPSTGNPHNT